MGDRAMTVLVVTSTTLAAATLFVAMRLVSRVGIVKHTTWDDYVIVLGWALAFACSFATAYATGKGLGMVDADIKVEWKGSLIRCEYVLSVLYNPAVAAIKSSILIFYLRLSRTTNKYFRIASYVTLAIVNVECIILTFLNIFQCKPISKVFDFRDNTQTCIPQLTLYLIASPVKIVTDIAILVLPIPILTGMQLPRKQKTILVITFSLGVFVTIVDVIRIYYLQQAMMGVMSTTSSPTVTHGLGDQPDFAYHASLSLMFSTVELNVGIICACIPTLKPLVKRIMPKLIERTTSNTNGKLPTPGTKSDHTLPGDSTPAVGGLADLHTLSPGIPTSSGQHPSLGGETLNQPSSERTMRSDHEAEYDMVDFLTMPGTEARGSRRGPPRGRASDPQVNVSSSSNSVYFGFVNIRRPKSMLKTSTRDSWKYCSTITILFFMWGFSYGLLNSLNLYVASLSHASKKQAIGLHSIYFGAYFVGPPTIGRYLLTHSGFKSCFVVGLCIYGTGTLMFWPSAILLSYAGFAVSNFVVGMGLSIMEVGANPFVTLCGPPKYGEFRLLMAQGVQAIGSVVSQVVADRAFLLPFNGVASLIQIQWTYLAFALFSAILALFLFYMPLPEATDEELARAATQPRFLPLNNTVAATLNHPTIGPGWSVPTVTLVLAVAAQLLYVGAQEALNVWFEVLLPQLTVRGAPLALTPHDVAAAVDTFSLPPNDYPTVGYAVFAGARFIAAALCLVVRPRVVLLGSLVGATVCMVLVAALPDSVALVRPNVVAGLTLGVFFFEGPAYPLIFAIALRGLGARTKWGAALVTAAVGGGGLGPWLVYWVRLSIGLRRAFCAIAVAYALAAGFGVWLCAVRRVREVVDWVDWGDGEGDREGRSRGGSWSRAGSESCPTQQIEEERPRIT